MEAVDVLGIAKICSPYSLGQRVGIEWCRDDMDMVGHQAVTPNIQPKLHRMLGQIRKVNPIIISHKEQILAVVAALDNMVWRSRDDYSS